MNRMNVAIGQYIHGDSYIYKLDPRFKIIATMLLMIAIFLVPNLYGMAIAGGIFLVVIISARLPLKKILLSLRPVMFLVLFSFIIQVIYTKDGNVMVAFDMQFSFWHLLAIIALVLFWMFTSRFIFFKLLYTLVVIAAIMLILVYMRAQSPWQSFSFEVTDLGLYNAGYFISRIILIVILTTILTITTSTTDINNGLESLMHPLRKILPTGEIAMMLSLTLRFVPTTLLETQKIISAQASRGIDFNEGNIFQKIKQMLSLLIPLFVVSIIRAGDLALAMEARGYVIGAKRSRYYVLKWKLIDTLLLILVCLLVVVLSCWGVIINAL